MTNATTAAFSISLDCRLDNVPGALGALASLGHIDRAWASSFSTSRVGPQLQGFRDVMGRILRGDRLGQATELVASRAVSDGPQLRQ